MDEQLSGPDGQPDYPTKALLDDVTRLLSRVSDFPDSDMKSAVYGAFSGLVMCVPELQSRLVALEFLCPPLRILEVKNGIGCYTQDQSQINVHFAIPNAASSCIFVASDILSVFKSPSFAKVTINMRPLVRNTSEIDGCLLLRRRKIHPDAYGRLSLSDDRTRLIFPGGTHDVVSVLTSPSDIGKYVPITRCNETERPSVSCWARTTCGSVVVLENDFVPLVPGARVLVPCDQREVDRDLMTTEARLFARGLFPVDLSDSVDALQCEETPSSIRSLLVCVCKAGFGITDRLIILTGKLVENKEIRRCEFLDEMSNLSHIMRRHIMDRLDSRLALRGTTRMLCQFLSRGRAEDWSKWMEHSVFLKSLVYKSEEPDLRSACRLLPSMVWIVERSLLTRRGRWSCRDVQVANFLCTERHCEIENLDTLLTDLRLIDNNVDRRGIELIRLVGEESHAPNACSRKKTLRRESVASHAPKQGLPCEEDGGASVTLEETEESEDSERTHHEELGRMRKRWPQFSWTLIGSGVVSDSGDVDVVVTTADERGKTLADAYDEVRRATGFVPLYDEVNGKHVVVLEGMSPSGVAVDAQVVRPSGKTVAELQSREAMALTTRLISESDAEARRNVRWLHSWFESCSMKGHVTCNLPGVAVTCLAVALTARNRGCKGMRLLASLRDVLCTGCLIDFDDPFFLVDTAKNGAGFAWKDLQRPSRPLVVRAGGRNVATRVTRAWTLHLFDTIAVALTLQEERLLDPCEYDAWRRRTMVFCGTMTTVRRSAVAKTLNVSAQCLSHHPLIESLCLTHTSAGDASSSVHVWCRLDGSADSCRYGFCTGDVVEAVKGTVDMVVVRRGSQRDRPRMWHLTTSPCDQVVRGETTAVCLPHRVEVPPERITDWILIDMGCGTIRRIPNAPATTVDVVSSFDRALWALVV